jgi:hypothetical protein
MPTKARIETKYTTRGQRDDSVITHPEQNRIARQLTGYSD